jgi:hypothetical protein
VSYFCPAPPLDAGPVVFDYGYWTSLYPEFAPPSPRAVTAAQGQNYFDAACLQCDNSCASPITDGSPTGTRAKILYMITSHVATLLAPTVINGGSAPPSPLVGRISNASEGSVSVAVDMPNQPMAAAWFQQTTYGALAWQSMAPYRTMRYARARRRYLGTAYPWGYGGPT